MARTPNSRTPTPSGQTQADTHLGGSLDPPSPPRASQKSHPFSALPYHGLPQALCTHFLRMSSHITAEQGGRVEFAAAQRPPPSWKDRPLTPPPQSPSSGSSTPPAAPPAVPEQRRTPSVGAVSLRCPAACAPPWGPASMCRSWADHRSKAMAAHLLLPRAVGRAGRGSWAPCPPRARGPALPAGSPAGSHPGQAAATASAAGSSSSMVGAGAVMWHCSRDRTGTALAPAPQSEREESGYSQAPGPRGGGGGRTGRPSRLPRPRDGRPAGLTFQPPTCQMGAGSRSPLVLPESHAWAAQTPALAPPPEGGREWPPLPHLPGWGGPRVGGCESLEGRWLPCGGGGGVG